MKQRLLTTLLATSILLSTPSIMRIPRLIPFLDADVRAIAKGAADELRNQGLWLVNADIQKIEKLDNQICFHWEYEYRSQFRLHTPRIIPTCFDVTE